MKPNLNREELAIIKEVNYTGTAETAIRECNSCGPTLFKRNSQNKWICIPCIKSNTVRSRKNKKDKLMKERGGECNRCGFDNVIALQWHHTDPLMGDRAEFTLLQSKSYKTMKEHTDKYCELICSNCHIIHHQSTPALNSRQPQ